MDLSQRTAASSSRIPTLHRERFELFLDDVVNATYDIFEDSFEILEESAPLLLGNPSEEISQRTAMAFDAVFNRVQGKLEKNLNLWEIYCRANCFTPSEDLSTFQEDAQAGVHLEASVSNGTEEEQLDAELESVRSELHIAGKEAARMRRQIRQLERLLAVEERHEAALQDVGTQFKKEDHQNVLEEMLRVGELLREKLSTVKAERIQSPRGARPRRSDCAGLERVDVEDHMKLLGI